MSLSNLEAFFESEEVIADFVLGGNNFVVTETGLCVIDKQVASNSQADESMSMKYSFVKYDSIDSISLKEAYSKNSAEYNDVIVGILIGLFGLLVSVGSLNAPSIVFGSLAFGSVLILLVSLGVAFSRSSSSEEDTNVVIHFTSQSPHSEWKISADSVDDEKFQKFVKILSKQL